MPSTRRSFLATAGCATVALAGCTAIQNPGDSTLSSPDRQVDPDWEPAPGSWPQRSYGPGNRRYNPHATPPRSEPSVDWRHSLGTPAEWLVVAEETVYVASSSEVVALNASTGDVRWEQSVEDSRGLQYVDGRLYEVNWQAADATGELWARSPDGDQLWHAEFDDPISALHEQSGYVYVGSPNTYRTLHADSGEVLGEHDRGLNRIGSVGESLYASTGGWLVEFGATGETLEEGWRTEMGRVVEPVIDGDTMYISRRGRGVTASEDDASRDLSLYGLDGDDQSEEDDEPSPSSLDITFYDLDGTRQDVATIEYMGAYITAGGGGVVAAATTRTYEGGLLDAAIVAIDEDSDTQWEYPTPNGNTAPVVGDETVYTATGESGDTITLLALDRETGDRLWDWADAGTAGAGTGDPVEMAATADTLYVGGPEEVLALRS